LDIAAPLYVVLKKDLKWDWTQKQQDAFNKLKKTFTSAPILAHFDGSLETIVETDASDYAVGAVLLQRGSDNRLRPIAHVSRTMVAAERNYETFDKEALAIIYALDEWRSHLLSLDKPFIVITDHRALQYFMTTKKLTRRQVRWAERLSAYKFAIEYRPGVANNVADALSRRDDVYPKQGGIDAFTVNNPENV
jgi:hypothetical protein